MPDDYTISSLTPVVTINNGDLMELSTEDQTSETGFASVKMTITQLATKLLTNIQYATDLETANKTIVGAINSLLDNMAIDYSDLTFPVASGACCSHNGLLYQANQDIPTAEAWNSSHWTQIVLTDVVGSGGGSGGHTILDNSGTALTQRTNLQFKGAYSEDNSGDDTTEVNVVRSMTKAQFNQLSSDEKVGMINVTDEEITATDIPISGNDPTDTKTYIDNEISGLSTVSSSTITPSVTGPTIKIYKCGKMRQLWINTQTYSNSGDVQIGTLPNDSKPANMIRFYFGDKSHYIAIETDGKIISSNGETYVVANIVYMVS